MCYFVVPVLSLMTGMIFALCLFWFDNLRISFFYKKVKTINEATHILVNGILGNKEVE